MSPDKIADAMEHLLRAAHLLSFALADPPSRTQLHIDRARLYATQAAITLDALTTNSKALQDHHARLRNKRLTARHSTQ